MILGKFSFLWILDHFLSNSVYSENRVKAQTFYFAEYLGCIKTCDMDTSRALVILASAGPLPSNQTCLLFSANCTLGDDVGNVSSELFMHVIVCG